jgi:DMSO reductase family type II enzyme heme b subunit
MTQHQVLKALPAQSAVPDAPEDPMWEQAEPMDFRLAGQVVAAPRWQNASIELVTVKAIYDENDIAFLLEWDDPFKDVTHDTDQELDVSSLRKVGNFNSYVAANDMVARQLETFRDAIALQFPVKLPEGTKKPHFMRGDSSHPVHLWVWKADLDAEGERAVEEAMARGWKQQPKAQAQEQQQIDSQAVWDQGRWRVVMKRPRITEDKKDVQFVAGKFIPMSMNAWDGSNGEHGLIMSLSTWHYVLLETATPMKVYLYAVLAVLATGALGYWLMRKAEQEAGSKA